MSNNLPHEIQVKTLADGVQYILPKRQLGKARWLGLIPLIFGGIMLLFLLVWLFIPAITAFKDIGEGDSAAWAPVLFGVFGLLFLIPDGALIIVGLAVLQNNTHSRILLQNQRLYAIERLGLIRLKRKRPADRITELEIGPAITSAFEDADHTTIKIFKDIDVLCGISAEGDGIQPLLIAPGYPRQLLQPFATELAQALDATDRTKLVSERGPAVSVIENEDESDPTVPEQFTEEKRQQPAGAKSIIEHRDDGLTITVPPLGFFKSSKGLGTAALLWTGFCTFFITMTILADTGVIGDQDNNSPPWWVYLLLAVFMSVGIGIGTYAYILGKRQAIIDVVGHTLLVTRKGVRNTTQAEWHADDLQSIDLGPSNMKVNEKPVMQLHIQPREGKRLAMLTQLDDRELKWIARTLRHALGVGRR